MAQNSIGQLIVNVPFEEPRRYWHYERETRSFSLEDGRRPAGYVVASESSKAFDDPGRFVEIPLVNRIRPRVQKWREAGYPGATGITQHLLKHWNDPEERENHRFFFCQLEAIETLIWWAEAPAAAKTGINIPADGGTFPRLCSKMATGTGKTIVMAMLAAWHILNKVTYPQDARYAKNVFVVAPGLTVRNRLQVLIPSSPGNYYEEFNVVPQGLREKLRQGKVVIRNWHALAWDTEERLAKRRTVDKRGAKSDEAYAREVLAEIAGARNIVVVNDEAHHAWRVPAGARTAANKDEIEEATKWVGGLDRINRARGILTAYDFSATPFAPSGRQSSEEALFGWIVSDFGLNDAIESGLVKTPRVVVRDDARRAKDFKSRLYHIYNDDTVKDDLNRRAEAHDSLPDLVTNAYYLLGKDWLETARDWKARNFPTPPVMITVANRTETAARVKYAFDRKKIRIDELCAPDKTLHIDSKVLSAAEAQEEPVAVGAATDVEAEDGETARKLTKNEQAELLRRTVDSVGQVGKPGEGIQNVISVGMLSEGWDAKTVTHVMGLRAFASQLLCEQVVGRGLRRTSYDLNPATGMFDAEYVNIFGVPFTFLPHESQDGPPPPPPPPKTRVEPAPERRRYEITFPNIIRIDHVYTPTLKLDMARVKPLTISAHETTEIVEIAPVIEGKPHVDQISEIDLESLGREYRMQKVVFETARDIYEQMQPNWNGRREYLFAQLVSLVERFLASGKIDITPPFFNRDEVRQRLLLTLNMSKVVHHIWEQIRFENTSRIVPVFDADNPVRSTADMQTWYTGKPCERPIKSHINVAVYDSGWEASEAFTLDHNKSVAAWVKNDHLGFEILYVFDGVVRKYRPDFIIRLGNGVHFVLETKGQDTPQDRAKRGFLNEWVRAVNEHGGFGRWAWAVSKHPNDVEAIIAKALTA